MTAYGLNNNTGTILNNSTNNFDKVNKSITSAGNIASNINKGFQYLNEWQNAQSGGEKLQTIGKAALAFMGK